MELYSHIKTILEQNEKFCKDGRLFRNIVVESALKLDAGLLSILLSDPIAKKSFFADVGGVVVFDKVKFQQFVSNKQFLPDSYTAFKIQIGLTADGKYLTEADEVVLDFPHKDCVLVGGQTKEDQKRQEVFLNETLAADERDRLFDPKALTNWKRFDKNGEHEVESVSIEDNLILKGNNLIALHSLKSVYKGKVKLIYIDPPYNTGSDSFGYNDSFNQSTWLTFMKNRLDVAKSLLAKSGVIMVQCSFHQFAYLKVLMCDIFAKHLCDFNIQVRHPDRVLTGDKEYNDVIEYILIFSNDKSKKMPFREVAKTEENYKWDVVLHSGEEPIDTLDCDGKIVKVFSPEQYTLRKCTPRRDLLKRISIRGSLREKNSSGRFYVKYLEGSNYPPGTLFQVPNIGADGFDYRYFYSAPIKRKNGGYYQGMPIDSNLTRKQYSNFYNFEREYNNVAEQGGVSFRNGKKPEELLKFLIELFTERNDIILDYHLGSGTTASTAHKMQRRYIGIEQMDYIKDRAINRLVNVINSEQTGISADVKWGGGGDFIYAELAKDNASILELVQEASNSEGLLSIWAKIKDSHFISYKVNPSDVDANILEFKRLELNDQKKLLASLLDKNQLYVNLSEIKSSDHGLSEKDKTLNSQFYGSSLDPV